MDKIPSFQKNHDILEPGLHFSNIIAGVSTYDLRFKKPNAGDYLSDKAMHSIEHMLATVLRNGKYKNDVIYFGPMGCRTGFYLLTVNLHYRQVLNLLKEACSQCLLLNEVPGAHKSECGNYLDHDLKQAKLECSRYLSILNGLSDDDVSAEIQKEKE